MQQYWRSPETYRVFYEIFGPEDPDCYLNITNVTVAPEAVIYYNIYTYMSGTTIHYVGRMMVNNSWTNVFDTPMPHGIGNIDIGWELSIPEAGSFDSDYNDNLILPVNFIEKIRVTYNGSIYPLDKGALPTQLSSVSTPTPNLPLDMIDVYDRANIFSDMAVKAN